MRKLTVVCMVMCFCSGLVASTVPISIGDTVNAKLNIDNWVCVDPKVGGIEVNLNGTTIGYNVGNDAVWAGCYLVDIENMVSKYKSFCMDVTMDPAVSYTGHTAYAVASDIEKMWATYYDSVVDDASEAAAFQLALWEMVHETGGTYDISSGGFYLEALNTSSSNNNGATFSGLINLANNYLDSGNWTGQASLVKLYDGDNQPFIVEVPEPTTLALFGLGGLLLRRKRRA